MITISKTVINNTRSVFDRMIRARNRALAAVGAFYRTTIRRSMRDASKGRSYRPSPPGSPPRAIRPKRLLKELILYNVNSDRGMVEIGPKRLGSGFTAKLLEMGGTRRSPRLRPGMLGVLGRDKSGKEKLIRLKTERQAELARRNMKGAVSVGRRPYLTSAVEKSRAKVYDIFNKKFREAMK